MTSKEIESIGLFKNMPVDELLKKANKFNIHVGFLATFYEKMYKITKKFLEIEKRISKLENGN